MAKVSYENLLAQVEELNAKLADEVNWTNEAAVRLALRYREVNNLKAEVRRLRQVAASLSAKLRIYAADELLRMIHRIAGTGVDPAELWDMCYGRKFNIVSAFNTGEVNKVRMRALALDAGGWWRMFKGQLELADMDTMWSYRRKVNSRRERELDLKIKLQASLKTSEDTPCEDRQSTEKSLQTCRLEACTRSTT